MPEKSRKTQAHWHDAYRDLPAKASRKMAADAMRDRDACFLLG
jgi:hypothetical protein